MKHLANVITICRIILSLLLLCFLNNRGAYLAVYIVCGLSDAIDGVVARKAGTQSTLGARLDSVADLFMFGVVTFSMIVWAGSSLTFCLIFIPAIVLMRGVNVLIAMRRYRAFVLLHTWANKLAGLLIFLMPVLFILFHSLLFVLLACIVSALAALEETAIHLTSKEYDLNRRSLLLR